MIYSGCIGLMDSQQESIDATSGRAGHYCRDRESLRGTSMAYWDGSSYDVYIIKNKVKITDAPSPDVDVMPHKLRTTTNQGILIALVVVNSVTVRIRRFYVVWTFFTA